MLVMLADNRKGVRRDRLERSSRVLTQDEPVYATSPRDPNPATHRRAARRALRFSQKAAVAPDVARCGLLADIARDGCRSIPAMPCRSRGLPSPAPCAAMTTDRRGLRPTVPRHETAAWCPFRPLPA
ncbi:hypothetical protein [Paracoccus mutanolyticus]|uniref:hypothetical protein n=1 Tax=Paracoccus mutanolyticus TaxID=1499308 RepID=UPI0016790CAD|nr:hypothetical protein [Paracoccus mutanolyticus]